MVQIVLRFLVIEKRHIKQKKMNSFDLKSICINICKKIIIWL